MYNPLSNQSDFVINISLMLVTFNCVSLIGRKPTTLANMYLLNHEFLWLRHDLGLSVINYWYIF